MGNGHFPFDAQIKLELVAKEFDFITHGSVDVVMIRCMMGQFCRMLHGEGCVPSKVLTRSSEGIVLYCQNNVSVQMTQSGVSCSWIMHMQLTNKNGKADGIPN